MASWFKADLRLITEYGSSDIGKTLVNADSLSRITSGKLVFTDGKQYNYSNVQTCDGNLIEEVASINPGAAAFEPLR